MRVCIYCSNHGYGHAARIAALAESFGTSGIFCTIVTTRPSFLFSRLNPQFFELVEGSLDFGLQQKTWLQADIPTTIQELRKLWGQREDMIDRQRQFLEDNRYDLVVADIPFLPCEAAYRAGIPVVAVSNFDWHFMYRTMLPETDEMRAILDGIAGMYGRTTMAFRLPFSSEESMNVFPRLRETGLLAKMYLPEREAVRSEFKVPEDHLMIMLSFGGGEGNPIDLQSLLNVPGITVLSRYDGLEHPNYRHIPPEEDFSRLLAASDAIITKLGYSTLAEARAAGIFIIYTDRIDFSEDSILRQGLEDYENCLYIAPHLLPQTDWNQVMTKVRSAIRRTPEPVVNDELAASMIPTAFPQKDKRVVIDVGSNNIQMLWAVCEDGENRVVHRASEVSALSRGMNDGMLQEDAIERFKRIMNRYLRFARTFLGDGERGLYPERLTITGTSCARDARNPDRITDWLRDEWDAGFRVLSAREEASLSGLGAVRGLDVSGDAITFDIGGGSVEFAVFQEGVFSSYRSFDLGLRRLENLYGSDRTAMEEKIEQTLNTLKGWFPPISLVIGIGGTVCNLAAVRSGLFRYDPLQVHGSELTLGEIRMFGERTACMSDSEIARLMPFEPQRASLIHSGIVLIEKILLVLGVDRFRVSDHGLMHGMLLTLQEKGGLE